MNARHESILLIDPNLFTETSTMTILIILTTRRLPRLLSRALFAALIEQVSHTTTEIIKALPI